MSSGTSLKRFEPLSFGAIQAILLAIVLSLAPHLLHLPLWLGVVASFTLFWALQIQRGRWAFPNTLGKGALVLALASGVALSARQGVHLEAANALLVAGLLLKPLELYNKRHAYVLLYLCYFLLAVAFVHYQVILFTFYQILALVCILAAHMRIHAAETPRAMIDSFKYSLGLLVQALPLMLLLFVFVPRLGPLWHNPLATTEAWTGLSGTLAPGDIAHLSRSNEPVFRVAFDSQVPKQRELYWRTLVLDRFDGRTWRQSADLNAVASEAVHWVGEKRFITPESEPSWRYQIVQEASEHPWLFALDWPVPQTPGTGRTWDYRLVATQPVMRGLQYQVHSYPAFRPDMQALPLGMRKRYLNYPNELNPKIQAWVQEHKRAVSISNAPAIREQVLISAFMQFFRQQPFYYSLQPPLLTSDHSIDEFLFDSRIGFCAHYASALALMLRAAGIPARMVAGYQGGHQNPSGDYWVVYQYDAHAWVEVWLPALGWQRLDPTAMVAPERIEQNLRQALGDAAFSADRALSLARWSWLERLNGRFDWLNYQWQRWVLNYDSQAQQSLWQNWLGTVDGYRLALIFSGSFIGFMGLSFLWLTQPWRRPRLRFWQQAWQQFCAFAAFLSFRPQPGEAPLSFIARIAKERPEWQEPLTAFANDFEILLYQAPASVASESYERLQRRLQKNVQKSLGQLQRFKIAAKHRRVI